MVNIKSVAKKAGVSTAAVSYALNNKEGVKEETRERIKKIAEDMGYIPNSLAISLLSKKTFILGLVAPDISTPYTAAIIRHLDIYAREKNYFLMLGSTFNDIEKEEETIRSFIARNVDGLIILPGNYHDEDFYHRIADRLKKRNLHFLFMNLQFQSVKANYIITDFEEGEYKITRYLLDQGLHDLAFVGGSHRHVYSEIRYRGFCRALTERGFKNGSDRYLECEEEYTLDAGYAVTNKYLQTAGLPEAFVTVNDSVAYGVIKSLQEHNLKVPRDVSVVGFDGIRMPTINTVALTTMRIPLDELARLSLEVISTNETAIMKQYVVQPELVEGQSVKCNYKKIIE